MYNNIATAIVIITLVALAGIPATYAVNKMEAANCKQLAEQARNYAPYFYATLNEAEACAVHAVTLSPVRVVFEDGSIKQFESVKEAKQYFNN